MDDNPTTTDFVFDHVAIAVERITDLWPTFAGCVGGSIRRSRDRKRLRMDAAPLRQRVRHRGPPAGRRRERCVPAPLPRPERPGTASHHLQGPRPRCRARHGSGRPDCRRSPRTGTTRCGSRRSSTRGRPTASSCSWPRLGDDLPPPPPEPEGFPDLAYDHPVASLGRVVHAVADLDAAATLYRDVLGGRVVSARDRPSTETTGSSSAGAGPGRLRLLEATNADIADWVGDRPGRPRHLFFNYDEPSWVPDVHQVAPARWVVDDDVFSHPARHRLRSADSGRAGRGQRSSAPPSTTSVVPVIHDAASEARNIAALAMSIGLTESLQRHHRGHGVLVPGPQRAGHVGLDQTGTDGVHPDGRREVAGPVTG